jgi:DUF2934 family protein
MARAAKTTKKAITTTKVLPMPIAASTAESHRPSLSDVAKRAFELYCERGCQDGYDVQDWIQAERELHLKASSTAA